MKKTPHEQETLAELTKNDLIVYEYANKIDWLKPYSEFQNLQKNVKFGKGKKTWG